MKGKLCQKLTFNTQPANDWLWLEQTFALADLSDWVWSGVAARRQGRAPRSAVEQHQAQPLLDYSDVPAERRLLDVELPGRPAEAARFRRSDQITELTKLNHT